MMMLLVMMIVMMNQHMMEYKLLSTCHPLDVVCVEGYPVTLVHVIVMSQKVTMTMTTRKKQIWMKLPTIMQQPHNNRPRPQLQVMMLILNSIEAAAAEEEPPLKKR